MEDTIEEGQLFRLTESQRESTSQCFGVDVKNLELWETSLSRLINENINKEGTDRDER